MIKISDKFRNTFPIAVTFTEGELPSAAKLNGLGTQAKGGLATLEYALGDIWNQSGDAMLATVALARLMVPNLGRAFGPLRHISPRIPYLPDLAEYTYDFTSEATLNEARLPFPPHSTSTFTWSNGNDASPQANKGDVIASGNWWIDYNTGDIYSWTAFSVADTLTYKPGYKDGGTEYTGTYGDLGTAATFNCIPDPATNVAYSFQSVKVEYKNGTDDSEGYYIYLPPRMPLDSTRRIDNSPQNDVDVPAHSNNFKTNPDAGAHSFRFFQDDASDAPITSAGGHEHYRYVLPTLITDNWSQAASIPAGYMYLWDPNGTGTIIEGISFAAENAATPRKYVLVATGANLTSWLATSQGLSAYPSSRLTSSSHAPTHYPSGGLRLITVGAELTTVLSSLIKQFFNHDHSNPGSMVSRPIAHSALSGTFDNTWYNPSGLSNDDHPQYLHRDGYDSDRGKYKGSMLGEIALASTDATSNFLNLGANSNKLSFGMGDADGGISMFWSFLDQAIVLDFPTSGTTTPTAFGTYANGTPAWIVWSDASTNNTKMVFSNVSTLDAVILESHGEGSLALLDSYGNPRGANTGLTVGHIYPGSDSDATYGYSGTSSSAWGPVRIHHASPVEFRYAVGLLDTAGTQWEDHPGASAGSDGPMRIYEYNTQNTAEYFTGVVSHPTSLNYTTYAVWPVNLPFQNFSIVQVVMDFKLRAAGDYISHTNRIFYFATGGGTGISDTVRTFQDVDVAYGGNIGLGTSGLNTGTTLNSNINLYPVSTSDTLIDIDRSTASSRDWTFVIANKGTLDSQPSIEFSRVRIYYRIKEW